MKTTRELVMAVGFLGIVAYAALFQSLGCHAEAESSVGWWVSYLLFLATGTAAIGIVGVHAADALRNFRDRWLSP